MVVMFWVICKLQFEMELPEIFNLQGDENDAPLDPLISTFET